MRPCDFCEQPVDTDDTKNFVQVTSWVSGPKLDGPKLRMQTGRVAHEDCVKRAELGQAPADEQPDLFEEPPPRRTVMLCDAPVAQSVGGQDYSTCSAVLDERGDCPNAINHIEL